MNRHELIMLDSQHRDLKPLAVSAACDVHLRGLAQKLEAILRIAHVVPAGQFPADAVAVGSYVSLTDVSSREELQLTLVMPKDADIERMLLSVLTPIGLAILGRRTGQTVSGRILISEVSHTWLPALTAGDTARMGKETSP